LRFVEAFLCLESLFTFGEIEGIAAIATSQCFICHIFCVFPFAC